MSDIRTRPAPETPARTWANIKKSVDSNKQEIIEDVVDEIILNPPDPEMEIAKKVQRLNHIGELVAKYDQAIDELHSDSLEDFVRDSNEVARKLLGT